MLFRSVEAAALAVFKKFIVPEAPCRVMLPARVVLNIARRLGQNHYVALLGERVAGPRAGRGKGARGGGKNRRGSRSLNADPGSDSKQPLITSASDSSGNGNSSSRSDPAHAIVVDSGGDISTAFDDADRMVFNLLMADAFPRFLQSGQYATLRTTLRDRSKELLVLRSMQII